MPVREPLSVAVITFNEERNLARCLASVAWADEIVVIDSGSSDRTVEIARRYGAVVVDEPWRGFTAQKNFALDRTRHAWVLSLDADEWLPSDAEATVRNAVAAPRADAYTFTRVSALAGGFVRRAWGGDRQVRLFRKDRARFEGGHVHESLRLAAGASAADLDVSLYHLSYRTIEEYVARMNRYTGLAARSIVESGRPFRPVRLIVSPLAAFVKHLVLKGGWRDGVRGVVVAAGSAFYVFLKYAKVWEARRGRDAEFARIVPATPEDPDPGAPGHSP